jgi:hypothetical protein
MFYRRQSRAIDYINRLCVAGTCLWMAFSHCNSRLMTQVTQITAEPPGKGLYRPEWNATHPLNIEFPMHVFIFQSRARPEMAGFTTRRTGANLPEELGPWAIVRQGSMHAGDPVTGVYGGAKTVLAGIERDGFYVGKADLHARRIALNQ